MFGAAKLSDEHVRAAAAGNREALDQVVGALEPQVRLMVAVRLSPAPNQVDAVDDLTQDALLDLSAGIHRLEYRTVGALRSYVSTITSRKVFMFLRRARSDQEGHPIRSLDSTVHSLSEAGPLWQLLSGSLTSPSSAAAKAERVATLMTELSRLKPEHRDVITLAVFDQLRPGEVGERLGISPKAASQLLLRAMRKLRQRLVAEPRVESSHG
jgi:RNA polymerase sigma-70 factor (ECF subfamily)